MAFVPQSVHRMHIASTVWDSLVAPLVMGGVRLGVAHQEVRKQLARFGFEHLARREVATLSGGEDQIVHLLCGLVQGRHGLIVDDPFGMLDSERTQQVCELLGEYAQNQGYRGTGGGSLVVAVPDGDEQIGIRVLQGTPGMTHVRIAAKDGILSAVEEFLGLLLPHVEPRRTGPLRLSDLCVGRRGVRLPFISGRSHVFEAGQLHVLRGPNGTGKSVLLSALVGRCPSYFQQRSGVIEVGGVPHDGRPSRLSSLRRHLSSLFLYVPQHCGRLLTTTDPVSFLERLLSGHRNRQVAMSTLRKAKVIWDRPTSLASVGEVRFMTHLLAAMALVFNPTASWLMADEPDAYLDLERRATLAKVYSAVASLGYGVILTSHRPELYINALEVM